ncbi:MAG: metallophosphoesterase [Sphingobacteriales bacterium]|nr:metallophosphoesterase [Sphingobacteriales bacterium]
MQAVQADGPYVLYYGNKMYAKYIMNDDGWKVLKTDTLDALQKASYSFTVATDMPGKTFTVKLKTELKNEKSEYKKVSKQLIISDIEGNFKALRRLLQANGVIDSNFNWIFGEGHLVLTGDFVDRGEQVTEVLWLIYSLEEKAKAFGGYVHFILGNHEIMNMSGDLRYLHPKYKENTEFLNQPYPDLYGDRSELGRWLRTKNVVEKIGDILFVHGGISSVVNNLTISVSKINDVARPFYADSTLQYPDLKTEIIYSDYGPFWYRGYYTGKTIASLQQVDSTLDKYDVKAIATGHTIVSDTISVHFNGKVFNTDVHHAKGLSGALLIEDGKFYRVSSLGEKLRLLE